MDTPLTIEALRAMSPEERTLKLFYMRRYSELLLYRMLKNDHIRYVATPDPHGGYFPRESFEPTGKIPADEHQRWLYEHLADHQYNYRRVLAKFEKSQLTHMAAPMTYAESVGTENDKPFNRTILSIVGTITAALVALMLVLGSIVGAGFILLFAGVVIWGYKQHGRQTQLGALYDQAFATDTGLAEEDAVIVGGLGVYLAPLLIEHVRGQMNGTVYLYQQPWYGSTIIDGGVQYFDKPGRHNLGTHATAVSLSE